MSAHEGMIFVIKLQGVLPRHDYFYRITEPTVNNCVFSEFLSTAEELKVKGLSQSESDRENKAKKRSLPPPLKGMKSITTKAFLIQFHLDMSRLLCTLYKAEDLVLFSPEEHWITRIWILYLNLTRLS